MKYIKLMRIEHYLKNLLIFFPLIFSLNMLNVFLLKKSIIGFVCFSIISSIVYIINDIKDIDNDRLHPIKNKRPLANGEINIKEAIFLLLSLFIILFVILIYNNLLFKTSSLILGIYFIINVLYSLGLKNVCIIDIIILSLGFVLRVFYGSQLIGVYTSNWLFLTVFFGSMYMALGKRKKDFIFKNYHKKYFIELYKNNFIKNSMNIFWCLTIIFYSLWSIFGTNVYLMKFSIVLFIFILKKYSLNLKNNKYGDPIFIILSDKVLIFMIFCYAILCITLLYFI